MKKIVFVRSNGTPDKLFLDKIEELFPGSEVYYHQKGHPYNQPVFEQKTLECDLFILGTSDPELVIGKGVKTQVQFALENNVTVSILETNDVKGDGTYKSNFKFHEAPAFKLMPYEGASSWQRYNYIQFGKHEEEQVDSEILDLQ